MKTKNNDFIFQNKAFVWVAIGTLLLLIVPFSLMRLKTPLYDPGSGYEVINWDLTDFIVMGALIFGTGSLFVLVARMLDRKYRVAVAIICALGFLWLWAELAVGIFTTWGS